MSLTPHEQYLSDCSLLENSGVPVIRLDPPFNREDVELDAVEAMDELTQELQRIIPEQLIRTLVPRMVARLLCFALDREPEAMLLQTQADGKRRSVVACSGILFFRYPEHQDEFMRKYVRVSNLAQILVNRTPIRLRNLPLRITFTTTDQTRPVEMELDGGGGHAPISGFPCSPEEIWNRQGRVPAAAASETPSSDSQPDKRKFVEEEDVREKRRGSTADPRASYNNKRRQLYVEGFPATRNAVACR